MKITFTKLVIAIVCIWMLAPVALFWALPTWSDRGQFGDLFGAINALFSGLAFAGLFWALRVQQEQLELQRIELSLQREELGLTRNELAKQASAQMEHAQTALKAARITALGSLLQSYAQFATGGAATFITRNNWPEEVERVKQELKHLLEQ